MRLLPIRHADHVYVGTVAVFSHGDVIRAAVMHYAASRWTLTSASKSIRLR
ncbi:MAG: hypothetical protein ABSF64_08155 [Bryobacteraceae bacterium]